MDDCLTIVQLLDRLFRGRDATTGHTEDIEELIEKGLRIGVEKFYFTGTTPPSVGRNHVLVSFREVIEHEIGHWFGLQHVNDPDLDGCTHDACMIMFSTTNAYITGGTIPTPRELSCDDLCMMHLLYCPGDPFKCPSTARRCNPSQNVGKHITDLCGTGQVPDGALNGTFERFEITVAPAHNNIRVTASLLTAGKATLQIFDVLGHKVQDLGVLMLKPEPQSFVFKAVLPSGTYYIRAVTEGDTRTRRLIIVR